MTVLLAGLLYGTHAMAHPDNDHEHDDHGNANWQDLLADGNLSQWRGYHTQSVPPGWSLDDGVLHFSNGKGDIVTRAVFSNFELSLEWKVSVGGNSGIFYLARMGDEQIYMSAPEMQVLDDAVHVDGGDPLTSAGAAYGLYPAPRGVVRSAGEWNEARVKVRNNEVEHWLNGQKIVSYTLGSPQWKEKVANAKFAEWPMYGQAREGRVGLQDHGDPVWYRNVRIREISP